MTFSILVRDVESGALGCAAATGNLAVGGWVLRALAGVGLAATQGYSVSSLWGETALRELEQGKSVDSIVSSLASNDTGADYRQLLVLDVRGRSAGWTGEKNENSKAHLVDSDIAVAGNWLANEHVLPHLRDSYLSAAGNMPDKLLTALACALEAGGDARGTQSAAIMVVSETEPPLDLRIDFSETPVDDLQALYSRTLDPTYREFMKRLPTRMHAERC